MIENVPFLFPFLKIVFISLSKEWFGEMKFIFKKKKKTLKKLCQLRKSWANFLIFLIFHLSMNWFVKPNKKLF